MKRLREIMRDRALAWLSVALAVLAALSVGCRGASGPNVPDIAGPCPGPAEWILRPAALAVDPDSGAVVGIVYGVAP